MRPIENSFRFGRLLGAALFSFAVCVHGKERVAPAIVTNDADPAAMTGGVAAPADAVATNLSIDVAAIDRDRILRLANEAMAAEPVTITKYHAKFTQGGANDFYSNGDFWWPNPKTTNGLPYIKRDGETNPDNFDDHRRCLTEFRDHLSALAAAYKITGENRYALIAAEWLRIFFLDSSTRMNPDLRYAQAVPGVWQGRGIGIIDSLPLVEVPKAVEAVQQSPHFPAEVSAGVKKWFADYLNWMMTSTNGQDVAEMTDDHGVIFWLQVAVYADYVGDHEQLEACHNRYKYYFLADQMGADGSFPKLMSRPKSYAYSVCQLDYMAILCQVLSNPNDDLWRFNSPEKGGIHRALDYMYPYLVDKSKWPHNPELAGNWPTRQSALLFAGLAYNDPKYLDLWEKLDPDAADEEIRNYTAVTQPVLWLK